MPHRSAHCGEDWATRREGARIGSVRARRSEKDRILIEIEKGFVKRSGGAMLLRYRLRCGPIKIPMVHG